MLTHKAAVRKYTSDFLRNKLSFIKEDLQRFKKKTLEILGTGEPIFNEAGKHLFESGGKHIRPILVILASRLAEYKGERHIELASIFELIHTATLLHDDVIDKADTRRGVETVNAKFGQDIAILEGDFLYAKSISLLVRNFNSNILVLVAEATQNTILGETMQVATRWVLDLNKDDYFKMIYNKTSFLISACCQAGGLLAEKDSDFIARLRQFGDNFGLAFQLVDDTFDFQDEKNTIGKPIGIDLKAGIVTLPLIYALESCNGDEKARIEKLFQNKRISEEETKFVGDLVKKYNCIELTLAKAKEHARNAKNALYSLPESKSKDAFLAITDFLINRDF